MADEKKIRAEIEEEDLNQVAGGVNGEPHNWRCRYCGQLFVIAVTEDVVNHYAVCPNKAH